MSNQPSLSSHNPDTQRTDLDTPPDSQEVVLSVQGVSKKFCRRLRQSLMYGVQDMAAEVVGVRRQNSTLRNGEFWALQDVSLDLRRGQALGLIGVNGSGKTTLLRIISGLMRPDTGCVRYRGRMAPLIALGAGFNPVLTGRENIYANMSILGLSTKEIRERFDAVVDFAEIGDAIEAPVQSYSSGMAARLGFASAINTEPDILLIDEVLAVGDAKFRGKCFRKLHELRQQGTAFILVSHNANQILTVCQSSVYLRYGEVIAIGDTATIMNRYEQDLFLGDASTAEEMNVIGNLRKREESHTGLDIQAIFFRNGQGDVVDPPTSGDPTQLCIRCQVKDDLDDVYFTIAINSASEDGGTVLHLNSFREKTPLFLPQGDREVQIQMPYLGLRLGVYSLNLYAHQGPLHNLDTIEGFRFTVHAKESMSRSLFYQPRTWTLAE
jgi:lipopolysaccharide transport system ATP-binding protein